MTRSFALICAFVIMLSKIAIGYTRIGRFQGCAMRRPFLAIRRTQSEGAALGGLQPPASAVSAAARPKLLRLRRAKEEAEEFAAPVAAPTRPAASAKKSLTFLNDDPKAPKGSVRGAPKGSNFVTVQLGTEQDIQSAEMEDRLRDAERWVSKKLSDKDASLLNRAMGIEDEVMAAMALDEDEEAGAGPGRGKAGKKSKAEVSRDKASKLKSKVLKLESLSTEETRAAAVVRGFLEMNPYICSGCGAPFQSNSGDNPGFLPKEKLQEHRKRAGNIREKQEAIRILELAGMEIDSPAAEELLREAQVPQEIISGVRALGKGEKARDNAEMTIRAGDRLAGSVAAQEDYGGEEDVESAEQNTKGGGASRMSSIKQSIAAAVKDDDNEDQDEEDLLDDMEIDLEELLASLDSEGEKDGSDAVAQSLAGTIARQLSSKIRGRGLSAKAPLSLINDIDTEITGLGRNQILPASQDNAEMILRSQREAAESSGRRPRVREEEHREDAEGTQSGDLSSFSEPVCICQRCFRLQQYGQVEQSLRPGWSSHELLTAQRFEQLLSVIKDTEAVVLCLVDLFDLQGSLLKNLKQIAGKNPIVIAANKADLFPKDVSSVRLTNWIHAEVKKFCDLQSPKESEEEKYQAIQERGYRKVQDKVNDETGVLRRANVHLVSCQSGSGMEKLLKNVMGIAADHGNKVYVMGAANVGKSSFINRLLDTSIKSNNDKAKKRRSDVPQATVSNLPGTTLDFLKIRLPNGITMIDTPGLLNPGQLTAKLTTAELRQTIPSKPINAVTLRVSEGKCVLIGGLAVIELTEVRSARCNQSNRDKFPFVLYLISLCTSLCTQGRPFFFTFFVSNEVKLHPTDSSKAAEFVAKHVGTLLTPPSSPERLAEIGQQESFLLDITGEDWNTATTDIVIAGLGWVSVTGPGTCTVKVTVPKGISVVTRPALLPYEAKHSTASFTGGRIEKKSRKPGAKSYGWRS